MKATYTNNEAFEILATVNGLDIVRCVAHSIIDDTFQIGTTEGWLGGLYTKDELIAAGANENLL
jgi:hypothetical protein